ncbi:SGNH/GDSL hydrolase family protein [Nocardia sp. NPDC050713]|uniref:SGNH/GDSL hydrolase family protein n=1 Tax=Nocardia sp. NPDC050713 TaxID=3154511 RepID=UPI0033CED4F4
MAKNTLNIQTRFRGRSALLATCLGAAAAFTGHAYVGGLSSAEAAHDTVYVAMGDSYAAGVGIEPMVSSRLCSRSAFDYASLVARELGAAEFRDVTCGGADVADFAAPQVSMTGYTEAPQYDALSADTTLVTVGIGGNDIGLARLAVICLNPTHLSGYSCAASNNSNGTDVYADKVEEFRGTYGEVIEEIRRRAPRAEIVMVGYPTAFRPGGCPDVQPILPADADYVQSRLEQLNAVMEEEAAAHGARYVDLIESTRGHDACAAPEERWLEGMIPLKPGGTPLHPNAAGHANAAKEILATVREAD